ncbi:hypothetical protein EDC04DRAFT_2655279 [Pisolithus marmoratus]|nr:hypothetical protein EDC04DRAFT_2655279 [Pisolithus marmoratus]
MRVVGEGCATRKLLQFACIRKTVDAFQSKQDAIEADRRAVDELCKQLDDPEAKARLTVTTPSRRNQRDSRGRSTNSGLSRQAHPRTQRKKFHDASDR